LPHPDAAFNGARWLTKNDADAEDVVQDAYVHVLRFFSSLRGEDARAWLLLLSESRLGPSCHGWRGHASGRNVPLVSRAVELIRAPYAAR
jgi:RNA polymerase sigma-70 factor, ECF subfamily